MCSAPSARTTPTRICTQQCSPAAKCEEKWASTAKTTNKSGKRRRASQISPLSWLLSFSTHPRTAFARHVGSFSLHLIFSEGSHPRFFRVGPLPAPALAPDLTKALRRRHPPPQLRRRRPAPGRSRRCTRIPFFKRLLASFRSFSCLGRRFKCNLSAVKLGSDCGNNQRGSPVYTEVRRTRPAAKER